METNNKRKDIINKLGRLFDTNDDNTMETNSKLNELILKLNVKETKELTEFLEKYIQETRQKGSYPTRNYFLINPMVID